MQRLIARLWTNRAVLISGSPRKEDIMRTVFLLATLAFVAPSAAFAGDPNQTKPNPLDKVVCKSDYFVGSMIPKRICLTKRQWIQAEQDGKDAIESAKGRWQPPDTLKGSSGG
jgi:hypothetical protein